MSDLGSKLKRAREERGVSLAEIATATKISPAALEALERNDYSRLPGGIFSRSFVRAYATAVGLDPEAITNEFLVELTKSEREAERAARARRPEISQDDRAFLERQRKAIRTLQVALLVVAVAAASALVYEAWLWFRTRAQTAQPPTRTAGVVTPSATPASQPPAPSPAPVAAPPAPVVNDRLAVEFVFTADAWMRLTADGSVVLSRIVKAGEKQQFDAQHEVEIDTGNAGGFTWSINGKPAKPFGKNGARQKAKITRDNFGTFLQ